MGAQRELADHLLARFGTRLGHEVAFASPPVALAGGHSASLYTFTLRDAPPPFDRPLVLRVVANDEQQQREVAVQSAVAAQGYPAPPVLMHGVAAEGFGRAYLVMAHVGGRTPLAAAGIRGIPRLFRETPPLLAGLMARLHEVPADGLGAVADGTDRLLHDVAPGPVRAWLENQRPPETAPVVCHGDLHGENLIVDHGAVVAVIDWELAAVGPAELDVARTALILGTLPGVSTVARRLLRRASTTSASRFVAAYRSVRPLDEASLRWFDVAHAARLLVVARGAGSVAELWRPLARTLAARIETTTGLRPD